MNANTQRDTDLTIVSLGAALVSVLLSSGLLAVGRAFGGDGLVPVMAYGLFVTAFGLVSAALCCIGVRAVGWTVTAMALFFVFIEMMLYFAVFAID